MARFSQGGLVVANGPAIPLDQYQEVPMSSPTPAPQGGAAKPVKKKWAEMSKEERAKDKQERLARAVEAVKAKTHKPSFPFKLGDFTLKAYPSGMTDKGSMTYHLAGKVIVIDGEQYRINQFSISQYPKDGSVDTDSPDWDNL